MTPAEVIALAAAIAEAFGLVAQDVVAFVKQRHPELAGPPPEDAESKLHDEAEADIRKAWPAAKAEPHDDAT